MLQLKPQSSGFRPHPHDLVRLYPGRASSWSLRKGAGKLGRHSVGTSIVGGMLLSTVLNLFFIPALYVILSTVLRKTHRRQPVGTNESVHIATS